MAQRGKLNHHVGVPVYSFDSNNATAALIKIIQTLQSTYKI